MKNKRLFRLRFKILRYQALLLIIAGLMFSSVVMFSGEEKQWRPYQVALSFDDGPHPVYAGRLLEILGRYDIPATFFLVGSQVERYPDLVKLIDKGNHELGNHTYNHPNLTALPVRGIFEELTTASRLIEQITGRPVRTFRPPGGNYNRKVIRTARSAGLSMMLWDVAPLDHLPQSPDMLAWKILTNVSDGDVILLHSGMESTLACLPRVIECLRLRGFRFVTASTARADRARFREARF